jgi:hypothetical protein
VQNTLPYDECRIELQRHKGVEVTPTIQSDLLGVLRVATRKERHVTRASLAGGICMDVRRRLAAAD